MGIATVRDLEERWFPSAGGPFVDAIHRALDAAGFTDLYVDRAIRLHARGGAGTKSKVVKDAIWGMVEIDWGSLRLLDSPIVQRLRGIRQLGFSYLTYPSAEHSRFIHSLGMYCVVSRFLEAIERRPESVVGEYRVERPDPQVAKDLSHAAILHDVGHMAFSHASETILEADRVDFRCGPMTVHDFMFDVEELLKKNLRLAECLSLAIILSPRFRRFYSDYVRPGAGDPEAVWRICSLIAGLPPRPELRGAADLVSASAVDADKVDYVNRDSAACGIPVGIDVARLFLRSSFLWVTDEQMRKLIPGERALGREQMIFVVNASGVDTVEELAQARASLYQRVYLHQTTRSAERLLARALEVVTVGERRVPNDILSDALELWALDDFGLLSRLTRHASDEVRLFGERLANRQLPKRAAAFGRTIVEAPSCDMFKRIGPLEVTRIFRQVTGASAEECRQGHLRGRQLRTLEADIRTEARRLRGVLGPVGRDLVPEGVEPELVTVLPMPHLESSRKDCIVLENDELSHTSTRMISDEQMDAADIYKAIGYVMADPDWREVVFIAARTVFYRRGQGLTRLGIHPYEGADEYEISGDRRIRLNVGAVIRRAGLRRRHVDDLMEAAERVGYFDEYPRLARTVPRDGRVQSVAARLRDFDGQGQWRVTVDSCAAFVEQFQPRLREEVLELLGRITVLDRATLTNDLRAAIKRFGRPASVKGYVAALSPDSGNFVRMILDQELRDDLRASQWKVCKSLRDALAEAREGDWLLLCDDNVSSGSQADSQLLAWFGVDRSEWPEEQRGEGGISDVPRVLPASLRELT